jgi:hypothetical protein
MREYIQVELLFLPLFFFTAFRSVGPTGVFDALINGNVASLLCDAAVSFNNGTVWTPPARDMAAEWSVFNTSTWWVPSQKTDKPTAPWPCLANFTGDSKISRAILTQKPKVGGGKRSVARDEPTKVVCKTTLGDYLWPTYDTWKAYLPNVTEVSVRGNEAHPNYFLAARSVYDVRTAVYFANKYNIRLSIISSGLDYLGR